MNSVIQVYKFGGDITQKAEAYIQIANTIKGLEDKLLITVSAARGITDLLTQFCMNTNANDIDIQEIIDQIVEVHSKLLPKGIQSVLLKEELNNFKIFLTNHLHKIETNQHYQNELIVFGEKLISCVLKFYIETLTNTSVKICDPQKFILTNGVLGSAKINLEQSEILAQTELIPFLKKYDIIIIPGYYGRTNENSISLLGRSGTDYTASTLAYITHAQKIIIWKGVDGFMTTDPQIIETSKTIPQMSYEEAEELAYFGAGILHPLSVIPAKLRSIPIEIINFTNPSVKTIIHALDQPSCDTVVKSVSFKDNLTIVRLYIAQGGASSGVAVFLTDLFRKANVNILSITTSNTCIALLISTNDYDKTKRFLNLQKGSFDRIEFDHENCLICVVGEGLGRTPGIASKVFEVLYQKKINVDLISAGASLVAYHFTVKSNQLKDAISSIHDRFFPIVVIQ